jgi:hypothetical protein
MRNLFLRRFRAGRLITLVAVITVGGLLSAVPASAGEAGPAVHSSAAGRLAAGSPAAAGAGAPLNPVAASSVMSGGGPASGGAGTAGCTNLATTSDFHEKLVSQAVLPPEQLPANAVSVPTWSGSFTTGGTAYPFTMVGSDPAAGQATHVPVEIIPLRLDFAGSGCVLEDSGMAADLEASPLFAPADVGFGATQVLDLYQRASFWSMVSTTSPGYHLLLDPSYIPAVTLHVPAAQGITFFDPNTNRPFGVVGGNWFFHQLLGLINSLHISSTTLPVFVPYNTSVTDQNPNDCLHAPGCYHYNGYHYAVLSNNNPHAINTFIMAAYHDFGTESTYDLGTYILSHELLEWAADPFDHYSSVQNPAAATSLFMNTAPAWSSPYYFNACQTSLEVADPLEGAGFFLLTNLPDSKYLVADGAFLSWFARQSPSTGVGGFYDLGSVFSTYSTAC